MNAQAGGRANHGLEGVVAAETRLSMVDGERGELLIAGLKLEDLARLEYEGPGALLWEAAGAAAPRVRTTPLAPATHALLRAAAERAAGPMDALRMAAGTLDAASDADAAALLVGSLPTIVAAYS